MTLYILEKNIVVAACMFVIPILFCRIVQGSGYETYHVGVFITTCNVRSMSTTFLTTCR